MPQPAARVGDFHMCPMVTPGVPPIPHVGGPIMPPGMPTVLIGGMPAATMTSMCVCTGPPDTIMKGSAGVMIGGKPAARMGDTCAHGGAVMVGCFTVLIGEAGGGGGGGGSVTPVNVMLQALQAMQGGSAQQQQQMAQMQQEMAQTASLQQAANDGVPFCEECP